MRVTVALLSLLLTGTAQSQEVSAYAVAFETVGAQGPFGAGASGYVVVRDEHEWRRDFGDNCADCRHVDFEREMMLYVRRASSGCGIPNPPIVRAVERRSDALIAWTHAPDSMASRAANTYRALANRPPADSDALPPIYRPRGMGGTLCTTEITKFRHAVVLPRSDLPVVLLSAGFGELIRPLRIE